MQTQYRLMYRYMNETTGTPVTNESEYNETREFYNPEHKLYFNKNQLKEFGWNSKKGRRRLDLVFWKDNTNNTDANTDRLYTNDVAEDYVASITSEAEAERENIILNEMANADKSNNFYIYAGTTKEYHQKFVPASMGYKVANYHGVPERQIPDGPNDFSKHFVMLGGNKLGLDDAYLACKSEYIDLYKTEYFETNPKRQQIILTGEKFANNFFFDWRNPQDDSYVAEYKETPARLIEIDSEDATQKPNTLFGGKRFITLSGEDYLITECVEYYLDAVPYFVSASPTSYGGTFYKYNYYYNGLVRESKLDGKRTTFGTLFFNCGSVLPPEITFATEDGETLINASDIISSEQSSYDGNKVLSAYEKYASTAVSFNEYDFNGRKCFNTATDSSNTNARYESDIRQNSMSCSKNKHQHILWFKGWKISDLKAANMGNYIESLKVTDDLNNISSRISEAGWTRDENNLVHNITRCEIPAHYEPSGKAPYIIKDNYKKIPLSPWILHSVHNSLESGLESARKLVSMIGIDNVKLIKYVPFDQFIEIK